MKSGDRLGAYRVLDQLGEGGMGEVYRARGPRLDRDVAIKILPRTFAEDPERRARFDREARMLASLNHPNIAQIYGAEETDGSVAIIMELVEGEDLAARGALSAPMARRAADRTAARRGARCRSRARHRPSLSRDESYVLFYRDLDGNIDPWTIHTARGALQRLTTDPADDIAPAWSPDGRRVAFSSPRSGVLERFTKALPSGSEELLLSTPAFKEGTGRTGQPRGASSASDSRVPQGDGRIDPRCTPGRSGDRQRGGDAQHDRHERERRQIQRPHSEQHRLNEPAARYRQHESDHHSGADDTSGTRNYEAKHVVGRRAKRPAHAEVAHVLLYRIGEDSENSDHGQDQREHCESGHHHRAEAVTAGDRPRDIVERPDISHTDELFLVDSRNRGADRGGQRLGRS
jgi:hypothetical protein